MLKTLYVFRCVGHPKGRCKGTLNSVMVSCLTATGLVVHMEVGQEDYWPHARGDKKDIGHMEVADP